MSIVIDAITSDGRPREVVFRFDRPLEDPSLRWLHWDDGLYAPFTLPQPGETVSLPASAIWESQTSPRKSRSASDWFGLGSRGQLSDRSWTVSRSVSRPAVAQADAGVRVKPPLDCPSPLSPQRFLAPTR